MITFVCFTFQSPSELGEIHISMSYYPTLDRLTIIVLRASNLRKMEPHGTGDGKKLSTLVTQASASLCFEKVKSEFAAQFWLRVR